MRPSRGGATTALEVPNLSPERNAVLHLSRAFQVRRKTNKGTRWEETVVKNMRRHRARRWRSCGIRSFQRRSLAAVHGRANTARHS